jgi:hypothetical protein
MLPNEKLEATKSICEARWNDFEVRCEKIEAISGLAIASFSEHAQKVPLLSIPVDRFDMILFVLRAFRNSRTDLFHSLCPLRMQLLLHRKGFHD